MAILNKCCFCLPLPIGGIILGVLSFIGSLLLAFICGMGLYSSYQKQFIQSQGTRTEDVLDPITLIRIVFWFTLILSFSLCLVSVLMVVGAKKVAGGLGGFEHF